MREAVSTVGRLVFFPLFALVNLAGSISRRKEVARAGETPPGRWPVQLRYETALTSDEYVSREAWREASLGRCPLHPRGNCSFARHGTYRRKTPAGTRIARWYCPQSHTTFSLLPDCLAARLPGTLNEIEHAVAVAEQAGSLAAAADALRCDPIELPGAVRWLRRRVHWVQRCLRVVIGLLPDRLSGCACDVLSVRKRLGEEAVLMALRGLAVRQLEHLPAPLGFYPVIPGRSDPTSAEQQPMGPDPPNDRL